MVWPEAKNPALFNASHSPTNKSATFWSTSLCLTAGGIGRSPIVSLRLAVYLMGVPGIADLVNRGAQAGAPRLARPAYSTAANSSPATVTPSGQSVASGLC